MSWLRLDDGYADHPKILELSERDRWRWTTVLVHCARYRTGGAISRGELARHVDHRTIPRLIRLRLLEPDPTDPDLYHVHDWHVYNPDRDPTAADRQRRWRANRAAGNPPAQPHACPDCDYIAGNPGGLARHRNTRHRTDRTVASVNDRSTETPTDLRPTPATAGPTSTAIPAEHNALPETPPVTQNPLPPVPQPRSLQPALQPTRARPADGRARGTLETIGTTAGAELERMRRLAGLAPSSEPEPEAPRSEPADVEERAS